MDVRLAQKIVDYLNELVKVDRCAIGTLVRTRIPCNKDLDNYPAVQCIAQDDGLKVGIIGILNGLCGIDSIGPIAAIFDGYDELVEFKVRRDAEHSNCIDSQPL